MTDLKDIAPLGLYPKWASRKAIIKSLRKITPWSMNGVEEYNSRQDFKNETNLPARTQYCGIGVRLGYDATALALEGGAWLQILAKSIGYILFYERATFFWHHKYDILFPHMAGKLHLFDWHLASETMAWALVLGWTDEALVEGYLAHAALNRNYQIVIPYRDWHRRGQAFMLRLFADWRGDVLHEWPSYAYDEPIYEGILERWRTPDPQILVPWLLAACDRHTHEARQSTEKIFYDFGHLARTPLEIMFLFRLRELVGLGNPVLDHPLMEPPYDRLPEPQPAYEPDELMRGTLARVRQDWPEFDEVIVQALPKDVLFSL